MPRIHTISLGCPKNRVDTERLLGTLAAMAAPASLEHADTPEAADLILVNTCGFIQPAVEESLETILDAARAKAPEAKLAVVGCLVSRYGAVELASELPEVDAFLSTRDLADPLAWPRTVKELLGLGAEARPGRLLSTAPHAYLKVAEGCRHACAFCTIPSIRGPLRSQPLATVLSEARAMLAAGARELVLVAQDLTDYGKDLGSDHGLADLVEALCGLQDEGLHWLRLMYLYPAGLDEALLERLQALAGLGSPLVPYFDVPLQHAHPDILKAMGRPFAQDPARVVERLRAFFPGAALRTSLITGYPGETENRFAALRDFVLAARFDHLGVFAFCPEEGTRAVALPDQVDPDLAQSRREELMTLQAEISGERLAGYVGRELEVLVEGPEPEWPGLFTGRAWFQAPEVDGLTYVSADPEGAEGAALEPGAVVRAQVVQASDHDLSALV